MIIQLEFIQKLFVRNKQKIDLQLYKLKLQDKSDEFT